MARHPDWFARLDAIVEVLRRSPDLEWVGRRELQSIFGCSERDSIRLLHKFGAVERDNVLSLPRSALLVQLEAIRAGSTYAAFVRQRRDMARHLTAAREEAAARQFRALPKPPEELPTRLEDLPETIAWRRAAPDEPGHFEIIYSDGADLMRQLADFLSAAGVNREQFFAATEPSDDRAR